MAKARADATAALNLAAERMKEYYDEHHTDVEFKVGQRVYLDTRNLPVPSLPRKLVDKYAGPYTIV